MYSIIGQRYVSITSCHVWINFVVAISRDHQPEIVSSVARRRYKFYFIRRSCSELVETSETMRLQITLCRYINFWMQSDWNRWFCDNKNYSSAVSALTTVHNRSKISNVLITKSRLTELKLDSRISRIIERLRLWHYLFLWKVIIYCSLLYNFFPIFLSYTWLNIDILLLLINVSHGYTESRCIYFSISLKFVYLLRHLNNFQLHL